MLPYIPGQTKETRLRNSGVSKGVRGDSYLQLFKLSSWVCMDCGTEFGVAAGSVAEGCKA